MSDRTTIEWCDHTWSPWWGCTLVSLGCQNCYASRIGRRFGVRWGKGKKRRLTKDWRSPVRWNRHGQVCVECRSGVRNDGTSIDCECGQVGAIGKTRSVRVFPSMCDWLDPEVPLAWFGRFMSLIYATPNLLWLLLTKRPELFMERTGAACDYEGGVPFILTHSTYQWLMDWRLGKTDPPDNVWVGTSVEDQETADRRIPELLRIPAAKRFVSVEPILGRVDLGHATPCGYYCDDGGAGHVDHQFWGKGGGGGINWVIVGAETGSKARPCNLDWIQSIVQQCKDAKVPCFVKALGTEWAKFQYGSGRVPSPLNRTGSDPSEWPEGLRVREMPQP